MSEEYRDDGEETKTEITSDNPLYDLAVFTYNIFIKSNNIM